MFDEAEDLFQQALEIYAQHTMPTHHNRIEVLRDYADLLKTLNRSAESQAIEEQLPHE